MSYNALTLPSGVVRFSSVEFWPSYLLSLGSSSYYLVTMFITSLSVMSPSISLLIHSEISLSVMSSQPLIPLDYHKCFHQHCPYIYSLILLDDFMSVDFLTRFHASVSQRTTCFILIDCKLFNKDWDTSVTTDCNNNFVV